MEPRSDTESVIDKIRRGEISALDAFAAELPEVFAAEILPKLAVEDTLRLAQVNKVCRDTVWSEDNVRSLGAKFQETIQTSRLIITSYYGEPIHWAVVHRVLPAVRALLKSEEEAYKTVTGSGLTALHYAVGCGFGTIGYPSQDLRIKIIRMLIEAGADINKLTNDGRTPLRIAAMGHPEATKILIDAGADLNISSPLRKAVQMAKSKTGHPNWCRACQACADLLIQAGATIPDDPDYYSTSSSNDSDSDDTSSESEDTSSESEGSGLGFG